MRDQGPLDQVEGALTGPMVLPNNQQLLARRSIVARRDIAHAAIADIEPFDNGEAERPRILDDTTTHGRW
jgi:hypothetical protein